MVHAVEELESSMPAAGQPVQAATIGSLLSRALATNKPQELVERILRLTQESSGSPASLDTTELDASVEVAELRKMKEEVMKQKPGLATNFYPPGKENKGENDGTNPALHFQIGKLFPTESPENYVTQNRTHRIESYLNQLLNFEGIGLINR